MIVEKSSFFPPHVHIDIPLLSLCLLLLLPYETLFSDIFKSFFHSSVYIETSMGAKLGKSKSLPISSQDNELNKLNSNPTINGSATLEKKNKRKKGKLSNQKSWDVKVDKFTSTEINCNASDYIKHLVNGSTITRLSYEARTSVSNQSGTPSKDVLELRDACIRRGIISPEMSIVITPAPEIEQEVFIEESSPEPATVPNDLEEDQQPLAS